MHTVVHRFAPDKSTRAETRSRFRPRDLASNDTHSSLMAFPEVTNESTFSDFRSARRARTNFEICMKASCLLAHEAHTLPSQGPPSFLLWDPVLTVRAAGDPESCADCIPHRLCRPSLPVVPHRYFGHHLFTSSRHTRHYLWQWHPALVPHSLSSFPVAQRYVRTVSPINGSRVKRK